MASELWLHIGMHRTASTSCQILLNYLATEGHSSRYFYYPKTGVDVASSEYGHNALVGGALRRLNVSLFSELGQELSSVSPSCPVIISAEEFWAVNPLDILSMLPVKSCKVVYFDREFFSWLGSIWSLVCFTEEGAFTPYEFFCGAIEDILAKRESGCVSFYDKDAIVARWHEVVGVENCRRIFFPPRFPFFSLISTVLEGEIPVAWHELNVRANFSMELADILKRMNASSGQERRVFGVDSSEVARRASSLSVTSGINFPLDDVKLLEMLSVQ